MAPTAIYDSPTYPSHEAILPLSASALGPLKADPAIFPDGLKTSGQHSPIGSLIRSYEDYPKVIEGKTVWQKSDFEGRDDKWQRPFTEEEIVEIGRAADDYITSGRPLTGISQDLFPLPNLSSDLANIRDDIIDGKGFVLFRNIPVTEWGLQKSATAYMGLGTYFGYFTAQNGRGHVLGHVKDLSSKADPNDKTPVRIYRTNQRQLFHTDGADLVGLLCIAQAPEGGESDIASTHAIWNYLQQHHPDAAQLLSSPVWYIDRKGEQSEGEAPYYRTAPFMLENNPTGTPRVYARFDPKNADSLSRFWQGPNPQLPPLSDAQKHAMECLEEAARATCLHMVLQPGDIQLLANTHVLHSRTPYTDWPAGSVDEAGIERKQRHLMRLWLATPESEGGWKLITPDSKRKKRGGIQVNDNAPTCPLDAE